MKKWLVNAGLLCLLSGFCLAANAETATFQIISDPVTGTWANFAFSGDGSVMAANYGGEIYRWTAATGFKDLGLGDFLDSSIGISRDGSTIISGHVGSDGYTSPALWSAGGVIDLGHPANGCKLDNEWGSGYGVSGDGTVAVGLAWYCPGAEGFRWTNNVGMKGLSHPAGKSRRASGISADGNTLVGFSEDPIGGYRRPVRWIAGKAELFAGADAIGQASAVSFDGSQIVGQYTTSANGIYAFYYSQQHGLVSLGTVSGIATDQSFANGVASNGMTVGWSGDPFGSGIQASCGLQS